jgi:hypothetical protein
MSLGKYLIKASFVARLDLLTNKIKVILKRTFRLVLQFIKCWKEEKRKQEIYVWLNIKARSLLIVAVEKQ